MEFAFHSYNTMAKSGIAAALKRTLHESEQPPVLLCIGSDLAIGDSLGPIVGTLLKERRFSGYVYGTLRSPVTAKEIKYLDCFLRQTHPGAQVIAIDAAVGEESELGLIKVSDTPLKPGSGANKRLRAVGDVSILGVLARKSAFCYSQLNLTRLNTVYTMADALASGIEEYFSTLPCALAAPPRAYPAANWRRSGEVG